MFRALDEVHFGPERTLNLRDSLPTAADARARAEAWLRLRQTISQDEVLVITGRGKGSHDGVAVVKTEIVSLLHTLRRQGVVKTWSEHSQGSIVVEPATMTELLTAPRRHRDSKRARNEPVSRPANRAIHGLEPETEKLLRLLAEKSLSDLGIQELDGLVEAEMARKLSILVRGLPEDGNRENALHAVIIRAIEELDAR